MTTFWLSWFFTLAKAWMFFSGRRGCLTEKNVYVVRWKCSWQLQQGRNLQAKIRGGLYQSHQIRKPLNSLNTIQLWSSLPRWYISLVSADSLFGRTTGHISHGTLNHWSIMLDTFSTASRWGRTRDESKYSDVDWTSCDNRNTSCAQKLCRTCRLYSGSMTRL